MTSLATEFPWSENFVLIHLPVSRAEQYYHALLRRAGWRTYALETFNAAIQIAAYAAAREAMPAPWLEPDPDVDAALARFDAKG